ncbi:hypothetical protein [Alteromonas sp. 14N.309.X.WAT.G.H12]|uniref:hypothetical protein n=1 Tax=Alteromonas sp. 14N.309.X.WAT.G.H12 TaxID=3120824 RepID=UPI002FD3AD77
MFSLNDVSREIKAFTALHGRVNRALNIINNAKDAQDPDNLREVGRELRTKMRPYSNEIKSADGAFHRIVEASLKQLDKGLPGSLTAKLSHLKNDTTGRDHYSGFLFFTPDKESHIVLKIEAVVDQLNDVEFSSVALVASQKPPQWLSTPSTCFIEDVASQMLLDPFWLPKRIDKDALERAEAEIKRLSPFLELSLALLDKPH